MISLTFVVERSTFFGSGMPNSAEDIVAEGNEFVLGDERLLFPKSSHKADRNMNSLLAQTLSIPPHLYQTPMSKHHHGRWARHYGKFHIDGSRKPP